MFYVELIVYFIQVWVYIKESAGMYFPESEKIRATYLCVE